MPDQSQVWVRPKTRGELRDRLVRGETCEVVTSNVETTTMLLHGWLAFDKFSVRPSENDGWSLFEPSTVKSASAEKSDMTA
jgi:hypothetical protein